MGKFNVKFTGDEEAVLKELIRRSGNNKEELALRAQYEIAEYTQGALREGILEGPVTGGIFTPEEFDENSPIDYPLDFIVPGTEGDYAAYTIPQHGRIPERHIEGDVATVQVYDVGSSIDWLLKFSKNPRINIVRRGLQVLEATFVRKQNLDGFHVLIGAAVDRNLVVNDPAATAGYFTKRLISLMKVAMQRGGGGNLTSLNPVQLTDLFLSIEGVEDVRTWNIDEVDDVTRREIFLNSQNALSNLWGVNLHPMFELGPNQVFQNYFTSIGGTLAAGSDTELAIGLDLSDPDVFVNPIRERIEVFPDPALHRQRRQGYYAWGSHGFGVLDSRRVIVGSY